ncbi:Fimbrial protein precursor [Planctomycetes bacterium MalM25]|nr:Fimbrial protein precursor [Planctomycetes bacterium MalM25]
MKPQDKALRGFTLVELLVVIAIIGILVALLLPAVQAAREAARRAQCQSQIKNVALAVLNYESTFQELPPSIVDETISNNPGAGIGNSMDYTSGWLLACLPFLEEQALFDSFDFSQPIPGNDLADGQSVPNWKNVQARGAEIAVLLCPSDEANQVFYQGYQGSGPPDKLGGNWGRNNYAANSGAAAIYSEGAGSETAAVAPSVGSVRDAPWSGSSDANLGSGGWPVRTWPASVRGSMGPNGGTRLAQLVDGTSKTMMIAEIRAGIDETDPRGVWALPHAGCSVVASHGSGGDANGPNVCEVKADDISRVLAFPNCNANRTDPVCMQCNSDVFGFAQAAPRSLHQGGVFIAHADGSVAFITDEIETTGAWAPCCSVWDHLIMGADQDFQP